MAGNVAGVNVIAGFTVRLKAFAPLWLRASVTCAVRLAVVGALGGPLITPLELKVIPAGGEPLEVDHVYDPVPPVAASVRTQFVSAVQAASGEVVVIEGVGLMTSVNVLDPDRFWLSVAFTVTENDPEAVGVPERLPVEGLIDIPAGKPVALQV